MCKKETGGNAESAPIDFDDFIKKIEALKSTRAVRNVVTRSGHRARGKAPSLKSPDGNATYESLVEEDFIRTAEVSSHVLGLRMRPYVLALHDEEKLTHYTPDAELRTQKHRGWLIEVKGDYWLQSSKSRSDLKAVIRRLRSHGLRLVVTSESDLRRDGLQQELTTLLRQRPAVPGYPANLDTTRWDPLNRVEPSADLLRRWREAQKLCDELLDRVMRRDPDEFVSQFE